jgi:hypothetical protein
MYDSCALAVNLALIVGMATHADTLHRLPQCMGIYLVIAEDEACELACCVLVYILLTEEHKRWKVQTAEVLRGVN